MAKLTLRRRSSKQRSDHGVPRTLHGKPVVDAAQPFTFMVTRRDCERGADGDADHCAAALALSRQVPNVIAVHVGRAMTIVERVDRCVRFKTPSALRDQTVRYDSGRQFEPGEYKLLPVPGYILKNRGKRSSAYEPAYTHARANPNRKSRAVSKVLGRPSLRTTTYREKAAPR